MVERRPRLVLVPPAEPAAEDRLPLTSRPDDDLMRLARSGNNAAFDTLVRRHQQKVLSVAARLLGGPSLSHDVAQNTFLQVYLSLPTYEARGKFVPFLNRVLLNQCLMTHRSNRTGAQLQSSIAAAPPEPTETADALILACERHRELQAALDQLSPKLRTVVVLRYSGGLTHEDIAEMLALPTGTVKRRVFDAIEKLRLAMEET